MFSLVIESSHTYGTIINSPDKYYAPILPQIWSHMHPLSLPVLQLPPAAFLFTF